MIIEEVKEQNIVAITGGVITKQIGSTVTFKLKCDRCGNAEHSESVVSLTKGVTEVTTRICHICGNSQLIKMKLLTN